MAILRIRHGKIRHIQNLTYTKFDIYKIRHKQDLTEHSDNLTLNNNLIMYLVKDIQHIEIRAIGSLQTAK